MVPTTSATASKTPAKSDAELVKRCVGGDEAAWALLIDKYKNLIFSIPIKYGFGRDEANDIFQTVCADLITELPRLRKAGALPAWLIQVTSHKCSRRSREMQRFVADDPANELPAPEEALPEKLLLELGQEQAVREALAALPPRCQRLLHMLFFETPCRPYAEIARELGLATGSIGFVRGRCLEKMRRRLAERGVK